MLTRARFTLRACLLLVLVGIAAVPGAAAASGRRNCGLISSKSWGGLWLTNSHREHVRVIRNTTCTTAKWIARAYNHNVNVNEPNGWSCFSGHGSQPFLFECGKGPRGHAGVQGYVKFFKVFRA